MTSAHDPGLQALFTAAEQEFDASTFRSDVMARIDGQRRRTVFLWMLLGLIVIAGLATLAAPVIDTLRIANQILPASLVQIETDWVRQVLSPVNSVAAAIALGALALRRFYRWIFG